MLVTISRSGLMHAASFALAAALTSPCLAQADFSESFDNLGPFVSGQVGPQTLIDQGWIFRNQSQPTGDGYYTWRAGPYVYWLGYTPFQPQAGAGYLGADQRSTDRWSGGVVSDWAILPQINGQQAGDLITLWARSLNGLPSEHLQIRYSPNRGTGTGSGSEAVGDFTMLLLDISPPPENGWGRFSVAVPGDGRLAIRYYVNRAGSNGHPQAIVGIDSLSVGPPSTPCPSYPVIPQPGQQVVWSAADSPLHVCADVLIPQGAGVTVEPGVTVNIDAGRAIVVEGALIGQGTQGDPIVFTGPSEAARIRAFGTLDLVWASINCRVVPEDGGSILLSDCEFAGSAAALTTFGQPTYLWDDPPFVGLERCTFAGDGSAWELLLDRAHLWLKDVTVTNTPLSIQDSYVWLDGVTVDGGPLELWFVNRLARQDVYVNNVSVRNFAGTGLSVGALSLMSADFFLGPDNVLESNLYPVGLNGGLIRGSHVPQTGNINNRVLAESFGQFWRNASVWAELPVPYEVVGGGGPPLTIEPGATLMFWPGADLSSTRLVAEGLPTAPIRFQRLNSAQAWGGLFVTYNHFSPRIEHCVFDGAATGMLAFGQTVFVNNSIFQSNERGVDAAFFGTLFARKSQFLGNAAGAYCQYDGALELDKPSNPNAFEGNAAGVNAEFDSIVDADFNWWGHPSGPQAPGNPSGQGDAVVGAGAAGVVVTPFLTSPPNFADVPPVVRIPNEPYRPNVLRDSLLETGAKVFLEWQAEDDVGIVEQKILFSDSGNHESAFGVPAFEEVATLPPGQRRFEWTVPDVPFSLTGAPAYLRIVAIDTAGQEGFDEFPITIPAEPVTASVRLTDYGGQTFRSGQTLPGPIFPEPPPSSARVFILLDGDEESLDLGAGVLADTPFASTDTARIGVVLQSTYNYVQWFFGDYFSLRPDPRIGDEPPTVQMLSPQAGDAFPGGTTVPITWDASDDEALFAFNVQASYDGGRTWHVIARDLPADARRFDWQLPTSGGIVDVRVRVIAKDQRFQNSSAGADRPFAITAGDARPGDLDGDGDVDLTDLAILLADYGCTSGTCPGDVDGDGDTDLGDLALLLANFGT